MRFFATQHFLRSLQKLCKKRNLGYYNLKTDLCSVLNQFETITSIIQISDTIKEVSDKDAKILLKTRYPNSASKDGKSGGFRSIAIADIDNHTFTFLEVYPKKGSKRKDNLSPKEYKEVLSEYINDVKHNSLVELDIKDDLSVLRQQ